jgi:hypothetical protein
MTSIGKHERVYHSLTTQYITDTWPGDFIIRYR